MSYYPKMILGDGPVAYYRLGELAGSTTVRDQTNNAYHGTITGGVTLQQIGALVHESDTAMLFDGITGVITLPASLNVNRWSSLTVECWLNAISTTGTSGIVGNSLPGSTELGFALLIISGNLYLEIGNGTLDRNVSTALATNAWYHAVLTFNGSTLTAYLNGSSVGSIALAGTIGASSFPIVIGALAGSPANNFFHGMIDEPAVYNYAMNATEIALHYQIGTTGRSGLTLLPTIQRRGV